MNDAESLTRIVVFFSALPTAKAVDMRPISATGFGEISTSWVWPALKAASVASCR